MTCTVKESFTASPWTPAPATADSSTSRKQDGGTTSAVKAIGKSALQAARKIPTLYLVFYVEPITGQEHLTGIMTTTQLAARRHLTSKDFRLVMYERAAEL